MNPYRREQIEGFVSDFLESPAAAQHPPLVREYGPELLVSFLEAACAVRDVEPVDIEERDLRPALLEGAGRIDLPDSVRQDVPPFVASFLEELETQGRLGDGSVLAAYIRVIGTSFTKPKPIVSPGAPLGRNDPCPCGSGKKYKKCCLRLLD